MAILAILFLAVFGYWCWTENLHWELHDKMGLGKQCLTFPKKAKPQPQNQSRPQQTQQVHQNHNHDNRNNHQQQQNNHDRRQPNLPRS